MSVYKFFAEKDATIYNDFPTVNTGIDAILDLSKYNSIISSGNNAISRPVIKFLDDDISQSISLINNKNFKAYLKIYSADVQGIPTELTIDCHPLAQPWDMGTGRYGNSPVTKNGVCWDYRTSSTSSVWYPSGSYPSGVTGSYGSNIGGGSWYTASIASQSFSHFENPDLEIDVTNILSLWQSGSINNNGFVLKNTYSSENDTSNSYKLTYFSRDTNTIYPPVLEIRWDDSTNITGSNIVTNSDINVSLSNNKMIYEQDEIHQFRINVRDQYPTRTFSTTSLYTTKKYLPTSSCYSIKDLKTDLEIIPFDDDFTKISSDINGNYFNIYMDGLEPERWYKIFIKSNINGNVNIFDNNFNFKIKK